MSYKHDVGLVRTVWHQPVGHVSIVRAVNTGTCTSLGLKGLLLFLGFLSMPVFFTSTRKIGMNVGTNTCTFLTPLSSTAQT